LSVIFRKVGALALLFIFACLGGLTYYACKTYGATTDTLIGLSAALTFLATLALAYYAAVTIRANEGLIQAAKEQANASALQATASARQVELMDAQLMAQQRTSLLGFLAESESTVRHMLPYLLALRDSVQDVPQEKRIAPFAYETLEARAFELSRLRAQSYGRMDEPVVTKLFAFLDGFQNHIEVLLPYSKNQDPALKADALVALNDISNTGNEYLAAVQERMRSLSKQKEKGYQLFKSTEDAKWYWSASRQQLDERSLPAEIHGPYASEDLAVKAREKWTGSPSSPAIG
jgi:hypothetical protein